MKTVLDNNVESKARYSSDDIREIYNLPFLELVFSAQTIHRLYQPINKIQLCTLSNIKSGNCSSDCKYCPQSSRYKTDIKKYKLLTGEEVLRQARQAKENGATRFCMGAAWRSLPKGDDFNKVLDLISAVSKLNIEVCCTLGMLTQEQAYELKAAGLTVYNHNLDTSRNFYKEIVTTHTYQDRLQTIKHIMNADIKLCSGGIIGLGESEEDRIELIKTLANLNPHVESVPINALVKIKGTPLENQALLDPFELVRTIATTRIVIPKAKVRLSAGRLQMSYELQTLCFLAGANSIFVGERLLTTSNPSYDSDMDFLRKLKLEVM